MSVFSDFGGLPYNSQPLGYGGDKSSGKYGDCYFFFQLHCLLFLQIPKVIIFYCNTPTGQKGLNYGGQPFDRRPDAMPGKYGKSHCFVLIITLQC